MTVMRGDVILVRFPFTFGTASKLRPPLVIQADLNNRRLTNVIVAAITTTTHRSGQPTQLLLEVGTAAGRQTGLVKDSFVTCENIATIDKGLIVRKLGELTPALMQSINDCLKAALEIV